MRRLRTIVLKLYGWLLHLFPKSFHQEFGDEILWDFAAALEEAERRGPSSWLGVVLREIRDLPISLIHAHWGQNPMIRILRSQPFKNGWRGAVGFGFAGAAAQIVSGLIYWKMVTPDNSFVAYWQVYFFDLFHTEHGLELIAWLPSALGSLITGLLLGLLLALFYGDPSRRPRFVLAVMLGWFLHDAVESILLQSFDLGFFLGTRHSTYLGFALQAVSGAFLALMFVVATSRRPQPLRWLAAGSVIYPLFAYSYVRLLFKLSIVTAPWFFAAMMSMLLICFGSVLLIAARSEAWQKALWMLIISAVAFPIMPYVGGLLTRWLDINPTVYLGVSSGDISWPLTLGFALSDAIYALPAGVLLGLIIGYLKQTGPSQLAA